MSSNKKPLTKVLTQEMKDLLLPKSTDFCLNHGSCSYLDGKYTRLNYKCVENVSKLFATAVAQRGWRRYGKRFVYPSCISCNECKSIRIEVKDYHFSRSQRKALKRNENTKIVVQEPTLSAEHLALYNKYNQHKANNDGWDYECISEDEYLDSFVVGAHDFGREILFYRDDKLVGVDLIDILDDGISTICCYYDPEYMWYSLGIFSVLYEIKLAQEMGLQWVYLGYWIEGNKAFQYKENFEPIEILEGYPGVFEEANWKPFTPKSLIAKNSSDSK